MGFPCQLTSLVSSSSSVGAPLKGSLAFPEGGTVGGGRGGAGNRAVLCEELEDVARQVEQSTRLLRVEIAHLGVGGWGGGGEREQT